LDILSDDQVPQGLKQFSNWPTYPQLYVKGKLVGGLDILNEMAEDGDLSEQREDSHRPADEHVRPTAVPADRAAVGQHAVEDFEAPGQTTNCLAAATCAPEQLR